VTNDCWRLGTVDSGGRLGTIDQKEDRGGVFSRKIGCVCSGE